MRLQGWGRFPDIAADLIEPVSVESIRKSLKDKNKVLPLIPRGAGRSYGDSALATRVISTHFLDEFIAFDQTTQTIQCGSGMTLNAILKLIIPKGYFIPVLPGTKYISVGGAIAADIHGKNHHKYGSFCSYVSELSLMLASGEIVKCSKTKNSELFQATCGGMGLTGIIIDAALSLKRVPSVSIRKRSLAAGDLIECMDIIDENEESEYSVAWLDCLASKARLGRSIIHLAEHCEEGPAEYESSIKMSIPFSTPSMLLNKYSISIFNWGLYNLRKYGSEFSTVGYESYFFPLDYLKNWNRLYGSQGFLQYQFVVPITHSRQTISEILKKIHAAGKGPLLSVLKKFGEGNNNYLSFPFRGYSLALDFKKEKSLFPLLKELDEIVLETGGRLYLAKDARMDEDAFKRSYLDWEQFLNVKSQVDPDNMFASMQSDRIGLT